jgi:hypothetical protein
MMADERFVILVDHRILFEQNIFKIKHAISPHIIARRKSNNEQAILLCIGVSINDLFIHHWHGRMREKNAESLSENTTKRN